MKLVPTLVALTLSAACSKSEAPKPQQTASAAAPAAPAAAPAAPAAAPAAPAAAARDPAAARKLIASGATVLDVRTAEEYGDGHLPSATNIPVQEFARRIAEVDKLVAGDKAKPVVVYCAAGGRAAKAKAQLEAAGYTLVVNGGGYDDLH